MPADPQALARTLAQLGLRCDVESEGALAILVPRDSADVPSAGVRDRLVRAARDAGFASVAFELRGADAGRPPSAP